MSGAKVADAVDALVDLWTGAGVSGLQVVDGAPYDVTGDFLTVGWTRVGPSVSGKVAHFDRTGMRGQEAFEVACLLSLGLGNVDMRAVRRQLFTTYDALAAALAADRTLGGAVMQAWIGTYDLVPVIDETGEFIDLAFSVACAAVV